ncbi:MAG: hypothetical protein IH830_03650 [Planctomycetes bacterium]|nr:hypothetical protein [Planctomycetota bacterium]
MNRITFALLAGYLFLTPLALHAQSRDTDLNVAIFAYLPDASTAIEKLEDSFERRYASIDLDLELWNPYDDAFEDDGLSQIVDFDIVEIDTCRIDELMRGAFGGFDAVVCQYSIQRSCRFSIVMIEESAESFTSGDLGGPSFWNPIDQRVA